MDFRLYVFTPTTHLFTFFLFFLLKKFAKVTKMYYLCTAKSEQGTLAERLGNGLQNRVEQFDSARYLNNNRESFNFHGLFLCIISSSR